MLRRFTGGADVVPPRTLAKHRVCICVGVGGGGGELGHRGLVTRAGSSWLPTTPVHGAGGSNTYWCTSVNLRIDTLITRSQAKTAVASIACRWG